MANPENERRLKNRFMVWLGETIGPFFLKILYRPNKWQIEGAHYYQEAIKRGRSVIVASWHGTLLIPFMELGDKGFFGIVGNHYPDAEIIARISEKLGWTIFRGSSTYGGRKAYDAMLNALKTGGNLVAITPDGPQGPAKKPKPGTIKAAQRTGAVVVPVSGQSSRHWSFTNWDTFFVAKPFGRVLVRYGEPIEFSEKDSFKDCAEKLTYALNELEKDVFNRV